MARRVIRLKDSLFPKEVNSLITYPLLETFRNALLGIFGFALSDFYGDIIGKHIETTQGFSTAFGVACIKHDKKDLYQYYSELSIDAADRFDRELGQLLVLNRLLLGYDTKVQFVAEALAVPERSLDLCSHCSKVFRKVDMHRESNLLLCPNCKNKLAGNFLENNYYNEARDFVEKEMEIYKNEEDI